MAKDFSKIKQQIRDTLYLTLPPEKTLTVHTSDIPTVLSKLGLDFSHQRIQDFKKKLDPNEKGVVDDGELVHQLVELMSQYDYQYVIEALKALDLDKDGKIPLEQFKSFIQEYGDKLDQDDYNELLDIAPIEGNYVLIDRFAKILSIPR